MENHEMWAEIVKSAGAKRIADATGYDLSTVYAHQRHPFDAQNLDGTGARGVLDRLESVVDTLAARSSSRVTLRKLQLHIALLFNRALDHGEARPADAAELTARSTKALRELADVIDECGKANCNEERLIHETLQVQSILDEIVRAAQAGLLKERRSSLPPMRVS